MKEDKRNIDKILQQRINNYSVEPDVDMWGKVRTSLRRRKHNRIILISSLSAAASIIVALLFAAPLYNNSEIITPQMISENNGNIYTSENITKDTAKDTANNTTDKITDKQHNNDNINTTDNKQLKKTVSRKDRNSAEVKNKREIVVPINILSEYRGIPNNIAYPKRLTNDDNETIIRHNILLAENNRNKITTKPKIQLNFGKAYSSGVVVTPEQPLMSFKTISRNDAFENMVSTQPETFEPSIRIKADWGVNIELPIIKNLSVISGLRYIAFSDDKNDDDINIPVLGAVKDEDMMYDQSGFNIARKVSQSFANLEIPVNAKYYIINKRISIYLLAGAGVNILVDNDAKITLHNDEVRHSKTKNLSDINLSGILGAGISYSFSKNMYLSIEPNFRHYFTSISTSKNVKIKPDITNVSFGIGIKL